MPHQNSQHSPQPEAVSTSANATEASPVSRRVDDSATRSSRVLKCTNTADLLAALPVLTGFTADHSLFIVVFHGNRGNQVIRLELPAHLRVPPLNWTSQHPLATSKLDQPRNAGSLESTSEAAATEEAFLATFVELLRASNAGERGPALVLSTSLSFRECGGVPLRRFARGLQRRMRREGWQPRELAIMAADGWSALLSPSPNQQRLLTEIAQSPTARAAESLGTQVRTLGQLCELPASLPSRSTEVKKALVDLELLEAERNRRLAEIVNASGSEPPEWLQGLTRVCDSLLETEIAYAEAPEPANPRLVARAINAAQVPSQWLVLALAALSSGEFVFRFAESEGSALFTNLAISGEQAAARHHGDGPALARVSLEQILLDLPAGNTSSERLRKATDVFADAAAHAPSEQRPAVLCLLAWTWWMLGLQSVAKSFVDEARSLDETHPLTHVISKLIDLTPEHRLHSLQRSQLNDAA